MTQKYLLIFYDAKIMNLIIIGRKKLSIFLDSKILITIFLGEVESPLQLNVLIHMVFDFSRITADEGKDPKRVLSRIH